LGCFMSIIGNDDAEMEYVKHMSDGYGNLVKNSPLNHRQGALAYHLVYISSLKYGLPSVSLTWSQIDQIHKYAVDKFLSVMGYDHSTHRTLVYGPAELGGLGVRHLYTETLGMKIDTVMSHIRAQSDLGKTLIININYIQLLSGLAAPILLSRDDIRYIPNNWILHIRTFLIEINATLDIHGLWCPKPQREADICIMAAFIQMKLSRADLIVLNNWRMYYRVIFLSEICYATGQSIQQYYMEYNPTYDTRQNHSNLNWPTQSKPDESSFKLWKRCIKACFLNKFNQNIPQLGPWNLEALQISSPRLAYYHSQKQRVYIPLPSGQYTAHATSLRHHQFINRHTCVKHSNRLHTS
jgi:hypothetical protein